MKRSFSDILKFCNNATKYSWTLGALRDALKRLENFGLIKIVKYGNRNSYEFVRFFSCDAPNPHSKSHNDPHNLEPLSKPVSAVSEDSNNITINKLDNIDLDNISTSDEVAEINTTFNYDSMIAKEKKAVCLSQVYVTIQKCFKELSVRSTKIKECVIEKIDRNIENITLRFARGYILKTIEQVKLDYNAKRKAYRKAMFTNKYIYSKKSRFRDFEQRNYDYGKLELALLGEDIRLSECYSN